jgi:hypothetical protein
MTLAQRFLNLFSGSARAHGCYTLGPVPEPGTKAPGRASTKKEPVTELLWQQHLEGKIGLGIIPIRDDGTVRFAAIDIDVYKDFDLSALEVKAKDYPVVVCRSKSGGAHLYMFGSEPLSASLVIAKLTLLARKLGLTAEIFPKQGKVDADRVGNWINMPYYGGGLGAARPSDRHAVVDAVALTPEEFLTYAEEKSITAAELAAFSPLANPEVLLGAPPCLAELYSIGVNQGGRDNAIYNFAVYAKRRFGEDSFERELDAFNSDVCTPPLKSSLVTKTYDSVKKSKTAFYKCNDDPLRSVCDKRLCKQSAYGIGSGEPEEQHVLGTLIKIDTKPPLWLMDVEGNRVELTTEELMSQSKFRLKCVEACHRAPALMKPHIWIQIINERLATCSVIPAPEDAGPEGKLLHLVNEFLKKKLGRGKDQLLVGKVWEDAGKAYFRWMDLSAYLQIQRFFALGDNKIWQVLSDNGGECGRWKIKGVLTRYWSMPIPEKQNAELEVPNMTPEGGF